jgi:hypothetical protein
MGCSRSLCCEVVRAVLFVCGGTPIHSFVNTPASRQSSRSARDLTPSILLRPSRGRQPSQSKKRSAGDAESTDNFRLAWASTRASSLRKKKSRCKPHYDNLLPPFMACKVSCPRLGLYNDNAWRSGGGLCGDATHRGIARPRCAKVASGLWWFFPPEAVFLPLGHLAMPPKILSA